jgi:hypothetical protein
MSKVLFAALFATLIASVPAHAQNDGPAHFIIGGGMTVPLSDISERFRTGGSFNVGLIVEPAPVLGLQVEYGFTTLTGPERRIPLQINALATPSGTAVIESHHEMHFVVADAVLRTAGGGRFTAYGLGGGGMYHRTISLTTPDVGFTTYCDPYWFVCYPTATAIDTGSSVIRPPPRSTVSSAIAHRGIRDSMRARASPSNWARPRPSTSSPAGTSSGVRRPRHRTEPRSGRTCSSSR